MNISIAEKKESKAILDHNILYRIKTETNISGRKIKKIARLLKGKDIKVQPYFQEALTDRGKAVEDFFESNFLDMQVYDEEDFLLWKLSEERYLVDMCA